MNAARLDYLSRALDRKIHDALHRAQAARPKVMAEATKVGALQSGKTLLLIGAESERAGLDATDDMVRAAYEATRSSAEPVCQLIEQKLRALCSKLSDDLRNFYNKKNWAGVGITDPLGNQFLAKMEGRIAAVLDDYRHGIIDGKSMQRDPLVNIVASITNSPGAILQSGSGSVQHAVTDIATNELRSTLQQFINSAEVQALPPEAKQSVTDIADVLQAEIAKPQPDASTIARWGKRLIHIATQLGIAVAATAISKALGM